MVHEMLKLAIVIIACTTIITKVEGSVENNKCRVTRCGSTEIRFPFHLKDSNVDHCVFPSGFQLSCIRRYGVLVPTMEFEYEVNTSLPGLYLSFSVKAYVNSIDYRERQLYFKSLSKDIRQHYNYSHYKSNSTFKPFTLTYNTSQIRFYINAHYCNEYTFYNCSSSSDITKYDHILDVPYYPSNHEIISGVTSLRSDSYRIYPICSHLQTVEVPLTSCTKMYNISHVPYNFGRLTWAGPDCGDCEVKGQYCKFRTNSMIFTECYPKGPSHKLLLTGKIGGIVLVLLTFVALCYAIKSYKQKKRYQLKVETFLEDYKALKPSRYSYADIKKITNQFKVKLGEGGFGSVFKGQLSNDVVVAVKILNDKLDAKGGGQDFINEVSTIGLVHHVNVVRLVGYCADGCRKALVYEFQPNNSLEKFVYREKQNNRFLGWEKMQDIAIGIAKGIEYLHRGCAQQILHFDIKPHNILLDQNFNPKISDFGLAKLCTKGQSMVSMTMARGTIGYIAPEVFSRNFGKVSPKSDVYSYGMLLLEMVGAKDHTSVGTENTSAYFPQWVFDQLEQGREMTSQNIEKEVDSIIAKKLTIVGLWCINWHPADRPSMKRVIQMLQDEDCPEIPPNPFNSASSRNASTFSSGLEDISESD